MRDYRTESNNQWTHISASGNFVRNQSAQPVRLKFNSSELVLQDGERLKVSRPFNEIAVKCTGVAVLTIGEGWIE
ncbi:hypothetical protein D8911_14620 (plasmid) [Levilactobacillus brevis]|nr:hypothetical protein D8911_14620 [Levilactobacillus brevis]